MPVRHETATASGRVDAVVAALFPELSRSRAAALVREGAVTVDGLVAPRPSLSVQAGAVVSVDVPPLRPAEAEPQDLPLRIAFEDRDLVVVDKEAGVVVHPSPGHPDHTLVNALLHHVGELSGIGGVERPGIVHRLDRGTSGLMVVAKHDVAHRALAAQFAEHSARRRYLALCCGAPRQERGRIASRLARHPRDRVRFASTDGQGKEAVTWWYRLVLGQGASLVGCVLETGRTHQIRVHLSESGWPIAGDGLYGRRKLLPPALARLLPAELDRPMLHAWQLGLTHPRTGERLLFTAPPPPDFLAAIAAVGVALPEPPGDPGPV